MVTQTSVCRNYATKCDTKHHSLATAWCCNRNPRCVPNAGLRLAQRHRRWADIQRVVLSRRPGFQGGGGVGVAYQPRKKEVQTTSPTPSSVRKNNMLTADLFTVFVSFLADSFFDLSP